MSPKRDVSYLWIAALAGTGGIASIAAAIGFPLYYHFTGRPSSPTFAIFGIWGIFAICGAAANIYTYRLTNPPDRPPRGGKPLAEVLPFEVMRTERTERTNRAA